MMELGSIEHFNPSFIAGQKMYNLVAQISYHQTDLLDMTDHFYSRVKISDQYYKMDGKSSNTKKTFANPENVILAIYKDKRSSENLEVNENNIYDTKALAFFRRSTKKYKEKAKKQYHELGVKERKKEWYDEEGHQGAKRCQTGSGKGSNPRLFAISSHFC